jgi:hypothetical protein
MSISAKIGYAPQTLREWDRKAEVEGGKRWYPVRGTGAGERPKSSSLWAAASRSTLGDLC